ncbi:MAG: FkbM family methyltransferase [Burkholderiales bacterium]
MELKKTLKMLARSGSLAFDTDAASPAKMDLTHEYVWKGRRLNYRPGTSDQSLIYDILLKSGRKAEYWLPEDIDAKTILDIGANIGIASNYLSTRFPLARIFAFEPVPGNFALLSKNVAALDNVTPVQKALGAKDGSFEMFYSDSKVNQGGFSFHQAGSDVEQRVRVEVRDAKSMVQELGIQSADLIKIDTEGSEYDILTRLGKDFLGKVKWIYGELHGNRDFELLAFLSKQFHIGVRKTIDKRLFMFQARNKTAA